MKESQTEAVQSVALATLSSPSVCPAIKTKVEVQEKLRLMSLLRYPCTTPSAAEIASSIIAKFISLMVTPGSDTL